MTDEPIADVVARYEYPCWHDPEEAVADATTLAHEVARLTEALHEATIEKGKAAAQWGIAMSEVARFRLVAQRLVAAWPNDDAAFEAAWGELTAIAAGPP